MIAFMTLLNNTFTISRRDRLDDGMGGWTIVYSDVGVVQGRIRPATSAERVVAEREERQITHVLYVAHGADIERGDLVTCDDLQVEVLGIREPSKAGQHLEIDCLQHQPEVSQEMGS